MLGRLLKRVVETSPGAANLEGLAGKLNSNRATRTVEAVTGAQPATSDQGSGSRVWSGNLPSLTCDPVMISFAILATQTLNFPDVTALLNEVLEIGERVLFGGAIVAPASS